MTFVALFGNQELAMTCCSWRSRLHSRSRRCAVVGALGAIAILSPASAADTFVFTDVPTVEELLHLWKSQPADGAGAPPLGLTRSIVFAGGATRIQPPPSAPASGAKASATGVLHAAGVSGGKTGQSPPASTTAPPAGTSSVAFLINFSRNSYRLSPEAKRYLDVVAETLRRDEAIRLTVVGHTDSTGGPEVNVPLSWSRAAAVKRYLAREKGIPEPRLDVQGRGEDSLLDASQPTAAVNRRVEFVPR